MAYSKAKFPLHWLVWENSFAELKGLLESGDNEIELKDPKGRTPLHLSVSLSHYECSRILLNKGADVLAENGSGWSVLHESISTGDPELVALILQYRDFSRAAARVEGIPKLLEQLNNTRDFYVEMKWEFTSWIPLLSKVCPSDVYRVWKKGSDLRVDTTLLGFDQMSWQRGKRSFVFRGTSHGVRVIEIDHDAKKAYIEELSNQPPRIGDFLPTRESVQNRLTHPLVCTHLNTDAISFERNKSGIWGWKSNKVDTINGYKADSFVASNVEFVTHTRTEHIDHKDKKKEKGTNIAHNALNSILGMAKQHSDVDVTSHETNNVNHAESCGPEGISPEEYFSGNCAQDIGRPVELATKTQKFKAVVWQSTEYPLSLKEQVTPFIDLMAISNAHFAKLKDFINLKLPEGFPIKIEIPLFHVLNALITFGNLNKCDEKKNTKNGDQASSSVDDDDSAEFEVDSATFEIPADYVRFGAARIDNSLESEDERLLQLAIQQSLLDPEVANAQVSFIEALNSISPQGQEEPIYSSIPGDDLSAALELSKRETDEAERRAREEEEELQRVLQLSLSDK